VNANALIKRANQQRQKKTLVSVCVFETNLDIITFLIKEGSE
jgi:hypothetical protein